MKNRVYIPPENGYAKKREGQKPSIILSANERNEKYEKGKL